MGSAEQDLLWGGIIIFVWIAYQSMTGKFAYKGKSARREENPPVFWFAMTFEGLFAVACVGSGLKIEWLAFVSFGLFMLIAFGSVTWVVGAAIRRLIKYPVCIWRHFRENEPQEAARELRLFLVRKPGDRETLFHLADAYERAGEQQAASELYHELTQTNDGWGSRAEKHLRKHSGEQITA